VIAGLKGGGQGQTARGQVQVNGSGCMGCAARARLVRMCSKTQKDILFSEIKPEMAAAVVEQVVVPGACGQQDREAGRRSGTAHAGPERSFLHHAGVLVLENNGKMDPEKLDGLHRARWLQGAAQGSGNERGGDLQGDAGQRPAWPRRRGIPDRSEVGPDAQGAVGGEVHHLQRRRGRPPARSWMDRFWKAIRTR